jgi:phage anti-repressor protein
MTEYSKLVTEIMSSIRFIEWQRQIAIDDGKENKANAFAEAIFHLKDYAHATHCADVQFERDAKLVAQTK